MSTALAVRPVSTFLALSAEGADMKEAMIANMGEGASFKESDLTRVVIPSGGTNTKWTIPGITGDEIVDAIEGILVYQCVRGVIWPRLEPEEGSLPAMVSHDLRTGRLIASEENIPEAMMRDFREHQIGENEYDWASLPQCQWDSGKDGTGKWAKEQRVLFVLRENDTLPLIVTVQPGSLKDWQKFITAMTKAGIPFWRAIIRLTLSKEKSTNGQPYCKIVPELAGVLSKEDGAVVNRDFTAIFREVAQSSFAG